MLARATTGIVLSQVTASAQRPQRRDDRPDCRSPRDRSATGTSLASYGNNAISNSRDLATTAATASR